MKRIPPALVLFLLSPAIGELLSGSSPPAEFFQPAGFILLAVLYGGGAVLVRELNLRWGGGWPRLMLLGAAYGVVEEGLMVKSFFADATNWPDLGILGTYGRWAGINWVWAIHLILYHALISIAIPITLVELLYPHRRHERWIGSGKLLLLFILFALDVLLGFLVFPRAETPYRPPALQYLLTLLSVILLILAARSLPPWRALVVARKASHPLLFAMLGFFAVVVFFINHWALPNLIPVALIPFLGAILGSGVAVGLWRRMGGGTRWEDAHRFALAAGILAFFILLAPLQEMDPNRLDNTSGMTCVGLFFLAFLIWMARRLRSRVWRATPLAA